jgi:hypothetical protein
MPTTNSESYAAMSLRCTPETRDAYRDAAARTGRGSSEILREALKLWTIRENLKPRRALAIINRATQKIECEVVLTPE